MPRRSRPRRSRQHVKGMKRPRAWHRHYRSPAIVQAGRWLGAN